MIFKRNNPIRTKFLILLLIAFYGFSPIESIAQAGHGDTTYMSLQQCIDFALKNQNDIKNAKLDEKIAYQKKREIAGAALPQVNGSGEVDYYFDAPKYFFDDQIIKTGLVYNTQYGASASQLLFDGTYLIGREAAARYIDLMKKTRQSTEIQTRANVTKAYYSVVVNKERIGLVNANLEKLKDLLKETQAMNAQGFVENIDVDRISVQLGNLQVESQNVQNLVKLSYYLLKFQMGMPMDEKIKVSDSIASADFHEEVNTPTQYGDRIEYNIIEAEKYLYHLQVKENEFGYLPSLNAFGSYQNQTYTIVNHYDAFSAGKVWLPTGLIGAKLSIPIFDGFIKDAKIQEAKLTYEQTENSEFTLKNSIDLQTHNALVNYNNNVSTLQVQKKNLDLAKEVARVTQIKYAQGVGSNLEIIDAQTSLREAETNYYNALYDVVVSQVDLLVARGKF